MFFEPRYQSIEGMEVVASVANSVRSHFQKLVFHSLAWHVGQQKFIRVFLARSEEVWNSENTQNRYEQQQAEEQ